MTDNSNRYIAVVHTPVLNALCEFCRQNAEFAQAICQSDKHFTTCLADDKKVFEAYFKTIKINNLVSAFSDANAKI